MRAAPLTSAFWARVAAAPHRLLLLDYDGTLAPHRAVRDGAPPAPGAIDRLAALTRRRGTTVAVVSGRRLADLDALLDGLLIHRVAEHGWDERSAGGRRMSHPLPAAAERALETAFVRARALVPPERLERKRAAVVLHTRGLSRRRARALERIVHRLWKPLLRGGRLRLDTTSGGLEIRAAGRDKGSVARDLLGRLPGGTLPVCLGDDRSDEDAFAVVARRGVAIRVGRTVRASRARARIDSPRAVARFLDRWLEVGDRPAGFPRAGR